MISALISDLHINKTMKKHHRYQGNFDPHVKLGHFASLRVWWMIMAAISLLSFIYLNTAYGFDAEVDDSFEDYLKEDFYEEAGGKVYMRGEFLDGDFLKISVYSEDVITPVLGIAFHLKYDGEKVAFLRYEPGEFLEKGGDPFYLVKNNFKENKIIFGETLRRDDRFPVSSGLISNFYFQIPNKDFFDTENFLHFSFESGVVSTLDTVRQDLDKIEWVALALDKNGNSIPEEEVKNIDAGEFLKADSSSSSFLAHSNILWFVIGLAVSFFVLIFIAKKLEKKRHADSVNFKRVEN